MEHPGGQDHPAVPVLLDQLAAGAVLLHLQPVVLGLADHAGEGAEQQQLERELRG